MLTVCEKCLTKFSVPDNSVTDGDMVQCSVCDHEWKCVIQKSDTTPPASLVKAPARMTEKSSPVEKLQTRATKRDGDILYAMRGEKKRVISSLIVSLIVLLLVLSVMRPEITSRVPVAIGVYQTIDTMLLKISKVFSGSDLFSSNDERVRASIVKATLTNIDNRRILSIRGLVRNISNSDVKGVLLNVDLRDDKGVVVKTISFKLTTFLKAGETETFKITVPEPPKVASDIQVRISN